MGKISLIFYLLIISFGIVSCQRKLGETVSEREELAKEEKLEREIFIKKDEVLMPQEKKKLKFVPGEALVKFKSDITEEEIKNILTKEYGCEILKVIEGIRVYHIRLPEGTTVSDMVKRLNNDPRVEYAEPNIIYRIQK